LATASSVASSTAWKRGDNASAGSTVRGTSALAPCPARTEAAVENAMAKSPLPFENEEPVHASP
jgi:hypothetical protein